MIQVEGENPGNNQDLRVINSQILQAFFVICGKNKTIEEIDEMLGDNFEKDIDFDSFYKFMLSFLPNE